MITDKDSLGSKYLYFNVSGRGFHSHFTCLATDDDVLMVHSILVSLAVAESNIASACSSSVSRFMSPPYAIRHSPKWSSLHQLVLVVYPSSCLIHMQ
jgi:hypothetical protein